MVSFTVVQDKATFHSSAVACGVISSGGKMSGLAGHGKCEHKVVTFVK